MTRQPASVLVPPSTVVERGDALADQVFTRLREAILSHELPPGARLSVPELARRLGTSRSPVREAVARIQHAGLARAQPHRGAVVTEVDLAALVQIYDIREVLEGLAARRAAVAGDAELVPDLEAVCAAHEEAVAAGDVATHMDVDADFHERLRRSAASPQLSAALERLQDQIRLAMRTTAHRGGGMRSALDEHREILGALRSGDGERAEVVARRHIRRLRETLDEAGREGS